LIERITQAQFAEVQESWSQYKESHPPLNGKPGNHDWDWLKKSRSSLEHHLDHVFGGIVVDDVIQGMIMMRSQFPPRYPCRMRGHEGQFLIYVEYLESAPWNVPRYAGDEALYKGVGVNLISVAVNYSLRWDLGGRVGLHSLDDEDTKASYTKMGFQSLGYDAIEGYDYFEFGGYDSVTP
jgi:hypothetical protein